MLGACCPLYLQQPTLPAPSAQLCPILLRELQLSVYPPYPKEAVTSSVTLYLSAYHHCSAFTALSTSHKCNSSIYCFFKVHPTSVAPPETGWPTLSFPEPAGYVTHSSPSNIYKELPFALSNYYFHCNFSEKDTGKFLPLCSPYLDMVACHHYSLWASDGTAQCGWQTFTAAPSEVPTLPETSTQQLKSTHNCCLL